MQVKKALEIFKLDNLEGLDQIKLKKKYYQLAKTKHPDKQSGSNSDFVELREAFLTLSTQLEKHSLSKPSQNYNHLYNLSKEEILDKYYHDTKDLQLQLEEFKLSIKEQSKTLDKLKDRVENLIVDFEKEKENLKKNLEEEISNLEKNFYPSFLQRVLFFLPQMNEEEFWYNYQTKVKKYSRKDSEIDVDFFKKMLSLYGEGLNEISKNLNSI